MKILNGIREKDSFIDVKVRAKLCAQQDPLNWEVIDVTKNTAYISDSEVTVVEKADKPKTGRKRKTKKTVVKTQTAILHKFKRNGKKEILLPIGGAYGIIYRALRQVIKAMGKAGYKYIPPLDLIQVLPEEVNIGKKKVYLEFVPVPRARGTRVLEAFETVETDLTFTLKVNSECPLTKEEICSLLHALEGLRGLGPAKRGRLEILDIRVHN